MGSREQGSTSGAVVARLRRNGGLFAIKSLGFIGFAVLVIAAAVEVSTR